MKSKWLNNQKNGHGQDAPTWKGDNRTLTGNFSSKKTLLAWCKAQGLLKPTASHRVFSGPAIASAGLSD